MPARTPNTTQDRHRRRRSPRTSSQTAVTPTSHPAPPAQRTTGTSAPVGRRHPDREGCWHALDRTGARCGGVVLPVTTTTDYALALSEEEAGRYRLMAEM